MRRPLFVCAAAVAFPALLLTACTRQKAFQLEIPMTPPVLAESPAQGIAPVKPEPSEPPGCAPNEPSVVLHRDCTATPWRIDISDNQEVLWCILDLKPGERLVLQAKAAVGQDPGDPARGRRIREIFQHRFVIPFPNNAIRSGSPSVPPGLFQNHHVVWSYELELRADRKMICTYDPEICVGRMGSGGCEG